MAQFALDGVLGLREFSPNQPPLPAHLTLDLSRDQESPGRDADAVFNMALSVHIGKWRGRGRSTAYAGGVRQFADDVLTLCAGQRDVAALGDWDTQDILWLRAVPGRADWVCASGEWLLFAGADVTAPDEPPAAPFHASDAALSEESSLAIVFRSVRIECSQLPAFADGILALLRDEGIATR